jgi:hypothetical protein
MRVAFPSACRLRERRSTALRTVRLARCAFAATLGLLILLGQTLAAGAERNTKPFTRFKVLLNGILNDTLPFDVPFIVWGDVRPETTLVRLSILELSSGTSCEAVPQGTFVPVGPAKVAVWTDADYTERGLPVPQVSGTLRKAQFELLVPKLKPSRLYCLRFQEFPGDPITAAQRAALSPVIERAYIDFLRRTGLMTELDAIGGNAGKNIEHVRQVLIQNLLGGVSMQSVSPVSGSVFDPDAEPALVIPQFTQYVADVFQAHNRAVELLQNFQRQSTDPKMNASFIAQSAAWAKWALTAEITALTTGAGLRSTTLHVARATAPQRGNLLVGMPADSPTIAPIVDIEVDDLPPPPPAGYPPNHPCPTGRTLGSRCRSLDETRAHLAAVIAALQAAGHAARAKEVEATAVKADAACPQIADLRCPLITADRVRSYAGSDTSSSSVGLGRRPRRPAFRLSRRR